MQKNRKGQRHTILIDCFFFAHVFHFWCSHWFSVGVGWLLLVSCWLFSLCFRVINVLYLESVTITLMNNISKLVKEDEEQRRSLIYPLVKKNASDFSAWCFLMDLIIIINIFSEMKREVHSCFYSFSTFFLHQKRPNRTWINFLKRLKNPPDDSLASTSILRTKN